MPAGVRHDAGGRDVTFLTAAPDAAERAKQLKLSAKQTELLRLLTASERPLTAKELAARAGCTIAPLNLLRKKGLIVATVERMGAERAQEASHPRQSPLELNPDQVAALGCNSRCAARGRASHDSDSRRDRQRQDRGLHPGDRRGRALRPAGDSARAGDQPHAANGGPLPRAVRSRGGAPQPHDRRRAARALAADREGRSRGRGRGAERHLRSDAAPWV